MPVTRRRKKEEEEEEEEEEVERTKRRKAVTTPPEDIVGPSKGLKKLKRRKSLAKVDRKDTPPPVPEQELPSIRVVRSVPKQIVEPTQSVASTSQLPVVKSAPKPIKRPRGSNAVAAQSRPEPEEAIVVNKTPSKRHDPRHLDSIPRRRSLRGKEKPIPSTEEHDEESDIEDDAQIDLTGIDFGFVKALDMVQNPSVECPPLFKPDESGTEDQPATPRSVVTYRTKYANDSKKRQVRVQKAYELALDLSNTLGIEHPPLFIDGETCSPDKPMSPLSDVSSLPSSPIGQRTKPPQHLHAYILMESESYKNDIELENDADSQYPPLFIEGANSERDKTLCASSDVASPTSSSKGKESSRQQNFATPTEYVRLTPISTKGKEHDADVATLSGIYKTASGPDNITEIPNPATHILESENSKQDKFPSDDTIPQKFRKGKERMQQDVIDSVMETQGSEVDVELDGSMDLQHPPPTSKEGRSIVQDEENIHAPEVVSLNAIAEVSGQVNGVDTTTEVCREAGAIVVSTIPRVIPAPDRPPPVRSSKGKERMLQEDVDAVVGLKTHDKAIELDGGFGIRHLPPCVDNEENQRIVGDTKESGSSKRVTFVEGSYQEGIMNIPRSGTPPSDVPPLPTRSSKGKEKMRQEDVDAMMELRALEEVIEREDDCDDDEEVEDIPLALLISSVQSSTQDKGKKRSLEDTDPSEPGPSKRVKIAQDSPDGMKIKSPEIAKPLTIRIPARPKAISITASGKKSKRSTILQSVQWKVVEPTKPKKSDPAVKVEAGKPSSPETVLRPRIWTNNRDELIAMMPEMTGSKCFNGISWELYDTPMILIDELNTSFKIEWDKDNPLILDLITTRNFVCPIPKGSDVKKCAMIEVPRPPSPFVPPVRPSAPSLEKKTKSRQRRTYKEPAPKFEAADALAMPLPYPEPAQQNVRIIVPAKDVPRVTFTIKDPRTTHPSQTKGPRTGATNGESSSLLTHSPMTVKLEPSSTSDNSALQVTSTQSAAPPVFTTSQNKQSLPSTGYSSTTHPALQSNQNTATESVARHPHTPMDSRSWPASGSASMEPPSTSPSKVTNYGRPQQQPPAASMPISHQNPAYAQMYNAPAPWAQESSSGAHANQNATPIQANQYQYYPPIFYGSTNSQSQWMSSWQQITYNAPNLYSLSGTVPYSTAGNTQPAQSESDQDRQSSSYYQQQQQPNSHSASSAPYFASASQQRPVIMDGEEPREMNLVNPRDPNPLGLMANGVSGQNGPPFPAAAGNMYTSQNASYHGWQQYPIYTYPPSLPMNAHIVLGTSPSQTAPTSQRAPVAEEKHGSLNLVDSQAQNSFTAVKNSVAAGTGSMRTTQANISSDGGRNSSYNDPPQPHNHSASISAAVGALPPASAPHQAAVPVAEKLPQDPNAVADSALREYVPSPLPEELAALVDSYLFGRPLTIILSGGVLEKHWSMKLPAEYGYAMLGFFKIIGVQETRVDVEGEADKSINRVQNTMSGRVRWKFHLQWAPGGEGLIFPQKSPSDLEYPWWNPPSPSQELQEKRNTELEAGEIPEEEPKKDFEADDPESTYLSTPRYRDARTRNHEYKFRNLPLGDLYDSVVPMHLLMPFGEDYMDLSFPRGWCCAECGRMNFQAALRHRKCPSSLCKDKKAPLAPYAQTLFLLRDPQERLPLSSPLNNFPEHLITTSVIQFPSGWQTFSYYLKKNPKIFMKHIFTSNVPSLQTDASDLLRDIQLNVPILRPLTESSQYFLWSAKCLKKITSPTDTKWTNIPETMNLAKELIVKGMRSFGGLKEDQVAVNHLSVVAWITVGSKKGIDLIRAKNKPVTFLALGCTVVLTVTPKSMGGLPTLDDKAQDATAESGQLPKTDIVDHDADTGGWIADNHEDGGGGAEESIEITKKGKTIAKSTKPSFVITLMHGDMMVFHGDEFEYSVKRDGTSLLLIASHDSLGHA